MSRYQISPPARQDLIDIRNFIAKENRAAARKVTRRFDELQDMKEQLSAIFGRRVDLVRKDLVANSKNYIRRKSEHGSK